jgi:NADP-dependent 3-hydroxy acid dehydrogenase YdfG
MMGRLANKVAVVTGASSGIGRSVALALAEEGADLALLGRQMDRLNTLAEECPKARCYKVDLLDETRFPPLREQVLRDFDLLYQCNVRAPFALTQLFLPSLTQRQGQIVFINSTAGFAAPAGISQYAATKHALKGFADSLREEVNEKQIRVISIFAGRTATPMQANVHALEGKEYHPEKLIQSGQIADAVISALVMGREAEVTEIRVRPMAKPGAGPARK